MKSFVLSALFLASAIPAAAFQSNTLPVRLNLQSGESLTHEYMRLLDETGELTPNLPTPIGADYLAARLEQPFPHTIFWQSSVGLDRFPTIEIRIPRQGRYSLVVRYSVFREANASGVNREFINPPQESRMDWFGANLEGSPAGEGFGPMPLVTEQEAAIIAAHRIPFEPSAP